MAEIMTCGTCGKSWDDSVSTAVTPVPAGRCPFEYDHPDTEDYPGARYASQVRTLVDGFEFELCAECGNDLDRHIISPDILGNAEAWCMTEMACECGSYPECEANCPAFSDSKAQEEYSESAAKEDARNAWQGKS
jgi:hypothetical protein